MLEREPAPVSEIELMRQLARAYTPGRSLERMFYTSPAVYERDMLKIWCENWIWAGHVSQIPANGDYFLFTKEAFLTAGVNAAERLEIEFSFAPCDDTGHGGVP